MIETRGLRKVYPDGTVGIDALDLEIGRREFVGLMGRSGAGKTTLLRLINGALRPQRGTLRVMDRHVPSLRGRELREYRRDVGVVYQSHGLVPSLSVLHNVLLGSIGSTGYLRSLARLAYVPAEEVRAVAETLEELGVRVPLRRRAGDLSGGQQQRVAVARALWQRPRLLLADEPVASVDSETADAIMGALARRNEREGLTVLVSVHQREIAMRYCRRVVVLEEGRLVYDGDSEHGLDPAAGYERERERYERYADVSD